MLDEVEGLLVDLLVLMALEELNFIQAYGGKKEAGRRMNLEYFTMGP